jgi:hypothetical protein
MSGHVLLIEVLKAKVRARDGPVRFVEDAADSGFKVLKEPASACAPASITR